MTTLPDCACDTIWSPQMEHKPGTHHEQEVCPLWRPAEDEAPRVLAVKGYLVRHQVRTWFAQHDLRYEESVGNYGSTFRFHATDEQWGQIQDWVKKVTG